MPQTAIPAQNPPGRTHKGVGRHASIPLLLPTAASYQRTARDARRLCRSSSALETICKAMSQRNFRWLPRRQMVCRALRGVEDIA
jgi:hypothetical protein